MAATRRSRTSSLAVLLAAAAALAAGAALARGFLTPPEPSVGRRAALLAAAGSVAGAGATAVVAAGAPGPTGYDWEGRYVDPMHPFCVRNIKVLDSGIVVNGGDGDPGCLKGTKTLWSLPVEYTPGSDTIKIDFTPKGGPKGVPGKWVGDGILFPDGNKWKRVSSRFSR
mmetsp:Transcript_57190/g.172935  ORF Transcript_57190/g.172935 Transcript_57190/m.172935 type:complete len:169 (+) Transcript_57190:64-570(+)